MPAANVTVTAKFKASALKVVDIDKVTLTKDTFGNDWHINFSEPSDYVENVTGFKVNGISWEEKSYNVSSGGAYRKYADDNYIQIAQRATRLPKIKYLSEAAMSSPFPQRAMKI